MQLLLEAGQGLVRLVTLAPEADPQCSVVRLLAEKGIAAAAGHTDASLETLQRSVDNGLSLFTHLGNACPQQLHRHDNILQRALALRRHLRYTFIADGVHVPFFVLRNCFDLIGVERCAVVSDAIAPAGLGPGRFSMGRWNLIIGEDLVARSPDGSHLVGSGQGLHQSRSNLLRHLGMTEDEADLLTSANPRAWASPA
jgi:N-acetylglucosamine-6-phosphate deacetylase